MARESSGTEPATCDRCGHPDVIGLHDDDCQLPDPTETICPQCAGAGRLEGGDTCGSCMGRGLHPVPLVDVVAEFLAACRTFRVEREENP